MRVQVYDAAHWFHPPTLTSLKLQISLAAHGFGSHAYARWQSFMQPHPAGRYSPPQHVPQE